MLTKDERILLPGQAVRVQPVGPVILSNQNGVIALYDPPSKQFKKGRRIDRVSYSQAQASREGVPIVFNSRQEGQLRLSVSVAF